MNLCVDGYAHTVGLYVIILYDYCLKVGLIIKENQHNDHMPLQNQECVM